MDGGVMGGRYGALRVVSALYKILAVLLAIVGVLAGVLMIVIGVSGVAVSGSGPLGQGLAAAGWLVGAFLGLAVIAGAMLVALGAYAGAELVDVQLSIEAHTRQLAVLTRLGSGGDALRRERILDEAPLRWE